MSKVYLLWDGEGSEVYVAGAYSTEEKARAAALEFNIKDPFIREEEVDTPPVLPEGWWAYRVDIGLDFEVKGCRRCSVEELDEKQIRKILTELQLDYETQGRPLAVVEVAQGFSMVTREQYAPPSPTERKKAQFGGAKAQKSAKKRGKVQKSAGLLTGTNCWIFFQR